MIAEQVAGVHHVALIVDDLDAAYNFYENVLGFKALPRPDFGFDGKWYEVGGQQIHIFPGETAAGRHHLALQVTDLEAVATTLEAAGVPVRRSMYFPGAGHQVFIKDPAGNRIELNEPDHLTP